MSALTKFLLNETHRKKMKKKGAGMKTPLTLRMDPHPDLDCFFVSNSKGELQVVDNKEEGVLTNFFELDLESEDAYHALLIDKIFITGCSEDWGGVAMMEDLSLDDTEDIKEYFAEYELTLHHIFCGLRGYHELVEAGVVNHPERGGKIQEKPTLDTLKEWQEEYFIVGSLDGRPIHLNEYLGPYLVFSSQPAFVGMLTRIDNNVSTFVHNAERGVVVIRFPEHDHDEPENDEHEKDEEETEQLSE